MIIKDTDDPTLKRGDHVRIAGVEHEAAMIGDITMRVTHTGAEIGDRREVRNLRQAVR